MTAAAAHSNPAIFAAELVGTFVLVAFATGTIVYDAQTGHRYGVWIAATGPFVALIIGVYSFSRISLAHFNPAVTVGFYITGHITRVQVAWYLAAQVAGALLGSLFVMALIGDGADLGANAPNPDHPLLLVLPVEILASLLLMAVILVVVCTGGLRGLGGVAIGGIVGLDILAFGLVSGASMNPARSLAPALLSGSLEHLWLYWSAPYVGTAAAALAFRKRFAAPRRGRRRPTPGGA